MTFCGTSADCCCSVLMSLLGLVGGHRRLDAVAPDGPARASSLLVEADRSGGVQVGCAAQAPVPRARMNQRAQRSRRTPRIGWANGTGERVDGARAKCRSKGPAR